MKWNDSTQYMQIGIPYGFTKQQAKSNFKNPFVKANKVGVYQEGRHLALTIFNQSQFYVSGQFPGLSGQ